MSLPTVGLILTILIAIVGILLSIWLVPLYRKLSANEKLIRAKEDEIDAVEPNVTGRTTGTLANENYRLKLVEKEKAPLLRELERLKQERQFITDKLPFFKN